jgi:hypothetical protein
MLLKPFAFDAAKAVLTSPDAFVNISRSGGGRAGAWRYVCTFIGSTNSSGGVSCSRG